MDQTEYERIIVEIQRMLGHDVPDVFCKDNIVLNAKYANKEEAIKACADIFIKGGIQMKVIRQICCRETKKPLCI